LAKFAKFILIAKFFWFYFGRKVFLRLMGFNAKDGRFSQSFEGVFFGRKDLRENLNAKIGRFSQSFAKLSVGVVINVYFWDY